MFRSEDNILPWLIRVERGQILLFLHLAQKADVLLGIFGDFSMMKYILVTGGVISGIGKGVISSSIGALLKGVGLHVTSIKIDPYLNIDAGTFSPYEHGIYISLYGLINAFPRSWLKKINCEIYAR